MKILVTGAGGQLGVDVVNFLASNHEVIGLNRHRLDIANLDRVINTVKEVRPDIIINTAAYTNVDECEKNIDLAYKVNSIGAKNLAIAALESNSQLLHISTDFVFDGEKSSPYLECDITNPINIYGKTKHQGEDMVKEICQRHYILRTSWLYGKNGSNFVKKMLELSESNKTLKVVDDQIGCPTYTKDLVNVIELVITNQAYGTYHVSNNGECSWNTFARKVFELTARKDIAVKKILSSELNRPAKRPKYSVMKNYMLELQFDYKMRRWEEALSEYLIK